MTALTLVPPRSRAAEPKASRSQRAALDLLGNSAGHLVVTGGAGTGKTTLAVMAAAQQVSRGMDVDRLLVLAPTRTAAARMRDRVSLAIGVPTSTPVARTVASAAFAVLSAEAHLLDDPPPSLVSGAEQDVVLRELLEGHVTGRAKPLAWGGALPDEATLLPGFREELRNLLMRAAEADLSAADLAELGRQHGREEWVAAAELYAEYEGVMALRSSPADQGGRYDPATIVARAADALAAWPEDASVPSWGLVIVDDYQDVTAAGAALLGQFAAQGARLMVLGNADESVQGYRGALPQGLDEAVTRWGAAHLELDQDMRQSGALAAVSAAVAGRIGVKGLGSARRSSRPVAEPSSAVGVTGALEGEPGTLRGTDAPASGPGAAERGTDASVVVLTAPHAYAQSRAIAAELRRARHGLDGEPIAWGRMAVVARSAALLRQIRSDLLAADIPCASGGEGTALHKESAVAPLISILRVALGEQWTEDDAIEVLTSRLVGLDPVGIRRLRRQLVKEERVAGGSRTSGDLLVDAMADPARWASVAGQEATAASKAALAVAAARQRAGEKGATPGAVIWAAWKALDVADAWRTAALAGSLRDDADLDAVIALLRAAQTFSERLPEARTTSFIDYLEGQDFAADTLGARALSRDVVAFATPASAAGEEWDLVVVAGVEEGVWPNLKLRDSVLGAQHLADLTAGIAASTPGQAAARAARAAVLDDEMRGFLVAVSRARSRLVVTAVDDGESRPSRLVSLVESSAGVKRGDAALTRTVSDLRSAVAAVRAGASAAADPSPHVRMLALLAEAGVQGADPAQWHGAAEVSTEEGFWDEEAAVRVSPSKVEWVEKCALRWALESTGGTRESTDAQEVGTLIHALAEAHPHGGRDAILADFEERWAGAFGMTTWPERVAYERAREKVTRLAAYLDSRSDREVLTEHAFTLEVGRAVLAGSADRVELREEAAYVVDLKTGQQIPSVADAAQNGQLAMYQLAVVEGAVPGVTTSAGAELAYVSSGKAGAVRSQDPIDPEAARERLAGVVSTMASRAFLATVNESCGSCPVRRACPAHAEGAQVSES
ncbi:PD-(D/E)XK nuclease family protein [Demequina sp. TTPB684]|uniref:UrvD/REP family ATP-dependent DNA helicase n=1 Tax=unclassified Demequina TaxID=2620311 RepID=UPI001CF17BE9|nr:MULTISPECIES: UrvD/REP family ATP-dependent DNA helicase [unclassified Demequina]MCB2412063.1 PD-(D/E)XK nuclease family protein [Demequina sp. TTPB684]UPU88518.1 PD-(D/E)XK nuclease family protein [Demequina sp. TMPB413]